MTPSPCAAHWIPVHDAVRWVAAALDEDVAAARVLIADLSEVMVEAPAVPSPPRRGRCVDGGAVGGIIDRERAHSMRAARGSAD